MNTTLGLKTIPLQTLQVRESISLMLLRLITIEIIFNGAIFLLHIISLTLLLPFLSSQIIALITSILSLIKTYLAFWVALQWAEAYYVISPTMIIHKTGFLFQKEEQFVLSYVRDIHMDQSILGKLLNYGTISLHDSLNNKNMHLYLIHNPNKYFSIIQELLPSSDKEIIHLRETLIDNTDKDISKAH